MTQVRPNFKTAKRTAPRVKADMQQIAEHMSHLFENHDTEFLLIFRTPDNVLGAVASGEFQHIAEHIVDEIGQHYGEVIGEGRFYTRRKPVS